jgi:RNA polymerase sigma factor (sigma-70 family)
MVASQLGPFLRRLRRVVGLREGDALGDAALLERFVRGRDEAAFEVLVWRYGPMVLGVCRRLLRHTQDAEDAFQATFLTLARKAAAVSRGEVLGGWLYRVAYRVALRARSRTVRRARHEQSGVEAVAREAPAATPWEDVRPVLDEEVSRLPARYRAPFILCYLEGKTHQAAAAALGCPPGTVASRLAWARRRLRDRLSRRGVDLSCVVLAAQGPSTSAALVDSTVRAALHFSAGNPAATASAGPAVTLAEGVLRAMFLTRLQGIGVLVLALCLVGAGIGPLVGLAREGKPAAAAGPELIPAGPPSLRLPADMATRLGVKTAEVRERPALPRVLELTGSLALDTVTRVRSRFAGEIVELGAHKEGDGTRPLRVGDAVKKDQLLAVLWSKDVAEKKGELLDALLKLRLDQEILDRVEKARDAVPEVRLLLARRDVEAGRDAVNRAEITLLAWRVPDAAVQAVREEADRVGRGGKRDPEKVKVWARVELRAPLAGVLVEKNVALGEYLKDGTHSLFTIADPARLTVLVPVPPEELFALMTLPRGGRRWSVRPKSDPEAKPATGQMEEIGYTAEPGTQSGMAFPTLGSTGSLGSLGGSSTSLGGLGGFSSSFGLGGTTFGSLGGTTSLGGLGGFSNSFGLGSTTFGSSLGMQTQKAVARGWVENPDGRLRAGQLVTVTLELPADPAEVALPATALVEQNGRAFVFVQPDARQPVYAPRRVVVVRRGQDAVHVRSRLKAEEERQGLQPILPGDRVVTHGAIDLQALIADLESKGKR